MISYHWSERTSSMAMASCCYLEVSVEHVIVQEAVATSFNASFLLHALHSVKPSSPHKSLKQLVPPPPHLITPTLQPPHLLPRSRQIRRQPRKLLHLRLQHLDPLPQLLQRPLLLQHLCDCLRGRYAL